jgi:L-lactate dehydrogenase complex protein LldE
MTGSLAGMVVQLFVTCLVDGFAPQVGRATVAVLEANGQTVEFPVDQTCCGQPALNAGIRDDAREMAAHTVAVLDATDGPIVVPSGSCAEMMIHRFPELLSSGPEAAAAKRVANRVRELTQFLTGDLGIEVRSKGTGTVTVHKSCHGLRGLGIETEIESLVDGVDGVERCELEAADECCGFGGLFSIELPEVSSAILQTKIDNIMASGADTVVGGDISCLMHIGGGLHRQGSRIETRHVVELLVDET